MTDVTPLINELHQRYQKITGFLIVLDQGKMFVWQAWLAKGWTLPDLVLVLTFLVGEIKAQRRWRSSLYFRSLIGRPEVFEEFLADARAKGRIPVMDRGKREVLAATGREVERKPMARTASEVMRDEAAFRQFKEWRAQNGL